MNTKSKNFKVAPEFEKLLSFSSEEEKLEHRAQMISYRILSEVEKICEERDIKMKELARMVNTSASYITQLFRGAKQVNTSIMARFEESLNLMFDIHFCCENELAQASSRMPDGIEVLRELNLVNPEAVYYCAVEGKKAEKVTDFFKQMATQESGRSAKEIA
jgi:transcriptional regulator with XRE-family HTH domain